MATMQVDSNALDALLASITADTVTASIHWRLYNDLAAAVHEYHREMNQSLAFWSLTLNAHRDVVLFRLGRLYDQHRRALSLHRLLDIIAKNMRLFDEVDFKERLNGNPFVASLASGARRPDRSTLQTDTNSVAKEDPVVQKLVATRNQVLAHRDPQVVLGASEDPSATLDASQIDLLLDRAADIANRYGSLFRANTSLMTIVGQDDYSGVLRHVRDGLTRIEQEFQEEIESTNDQGRAV